MSKFSADEKLEKKANAPQKAPGKQTESKPNIKSEKKTERKKEPGSRLALRLNMALIFLIVLIVGVVIGFSVTQLRAMQNTIDLTAAQYQQSQKNYLAAQAALTNLKESVAQQEAVLATQQKSLNKFVSAKRHQEWQKQEITYLINLANYALTFSRDPATAYALLNTADSTIVDLNDPSMVALRQSIGQSLNALKGEKTQDITGLFIDLSNLKANIASAPLMGDRPAPTKQYEKKIDG